MNKILPSAHLLEVYMPVAGNETFLMDLLEDLSHCEFYKGVEMPVFFQAESKKRLSRLVEEKHYRLTTWLSPNINEKGYDLSALDPELRKKSVAFTRELIGHCGDVGTDFLGLPSGADPGEGAREDAKKALFESYCELSQAAGQYPGMKLNLEPLDRYAHKKQLMGPILEVVEWFKELRRECPNFYLHWDSAHEALAHIDLSESLAAALPYMSQLHLCNCVTDPAHPCYGDFHMEVGPAPEYRNWGYLNLDVAAALLRQAAEAQPCEGIQNLHFALEVRTHMGDDLLKREQEVRGFMMAAFDRAGLEYDR